MSDASSPAPAGSRTSNLRRLYRVQYAPVIPLEPGAVIARKYRILRLLGEGGMGAVYKAERLSDGSRVAVKVMRSEHSVDATMAERFAREASVASRIASPHVAVIHDSGRADDGTMYLVMELLRGRSLFHYLDEKIVLPWREAAHIARDVAKGLDAVHGAGVVHRDLKPDNLFLCEDGRIKMLDFGIAKEWVPGWERGKIKGKPLTQAGIAIGTPLYMSPEAVTQSPVGPPTDLYALGAILFEMLTGRLLFEEEESVILMGHQLRTKPDRVRAVRPDLRVPAELDELVDRLLAKDPKKRPASASSVVEALDHVLGETASSDSGAWFMKSSADHRRDGAQGAALVAHEDGDGSLIDVSDETAPRGSEDRRFDRTQVEATPRGAAPTTETDAAHGLTALRASAPGTTRRLAAGRAAIAIAIGMALVATGAAAWIASGGGAVEPIVVPLSEASAAPSGPQLPATTPSEMRESSNEPAAAPEPPDVDVASVTIVFDVSPANARISHGGAALAGREVRVPRDGTSHEFLIEARGFVSQPVVVEASEDRTVRVALRSRPSGTRVGGTSGDIAREF